MILQKSYPELKSGFILVYKPPGLTSFDVVDHIRTITGVKKVGHAGTLDPFAEGLLILAIGQTATRQISSLVNETKEYEFVLQFGKETSTLDPEGDVISEKDIPESLYDRLDSVLNAFVKTYDQIPPQFSAKKVNGKRAYKLARKGIKVEIPPTTVTIHSMKLLATSKENHTCTLHITCTKGTYVRSLAKDIAAKLETVGYVTWLKRSAIGPYRIDTALQLDTITLESIKEAMFNITHD
jgi:tRNA pseudouridine55 synthase